MIARRASWRPTQPKPLRAVRNDACNTPMYLTTSVVIAAYRA